MTQEQLKDVMISIIDKSVNKQKNKDFVFVFENLYKKKPIVEYKLCGSFSYNLSKFLKLLKSETNKIDSELVVEEVRLSNISDIIKAIEPVVEFQNEMLSKDMQVCEEEKLQLIKIIKGEIVDVNQRKKEYLIERLEQIYDLQRILFEKYYNLYQEAVVDFISKRGVILKSKYVEDILDVVQQELSRDMYNLRYINEQLFTWKREQRRSRTEPHQSYVLSPIKERDMSRRW